MASTRSWSQRGLATVEVAIVTPILAMLLMGVAELGRACFQYNTLVKATRDGARYLSQIVKTPAGVMQDPASATCTDPNSTTSINCKTGTQNLVVYGNASGSGTAVLPSFDISTVTVTTTTTGGIDYVVITATYSFSPIFGALPSFGLGGTITTTGKTFTATSQMVAI